MVPLVYSPRYNITVFGLEKLHPFDGSKYCRIHDWLIRRGLRKPKEFVTPDSVRRQDLLRVHTEPYLSTLLDPKVLAQILEVPLLGKLPAIFTNWRVLRPMRWATGGTVLACRLAIEQGLAINLGGGYHHAGSNKGGGFCVYADAALAVSLLHSEGRFQNALIIDTDAHQGNGTADIIRNWPWAHMLDFFEEDIFPWPKVEEDIAVPLATGTTGREYLDLLSERVPNALDRLRPDFVFYNAGSDVLATDPLARLLLKPDDMAERDLFVVSQARERGIPVAMVLSGGYGPASWHAHAQSIEAILARFDQ